MSQYNLLSKAELDQLMKTTSPHSFKFNIARMHQIYKLPTNDHATLEVGESPIKRLDGFFKTLSDEAAEYNVSTDGKPSIREKLEQFYAMSASQFTTEEIEEARRDVLTDIADWLSDLTVYIRSEGMKFGIPLEDTLDAVMASNFSKIKGGVDGTPTYDENGKVMKDLSCYQPPENAIKTILFGLKSRHPYENISE